MILSIFKKVMNSIALVPTVLALSFLSFAVILLLIPVDYNSIDPLQFFIIDDKEDIQTIFSFIIGGIFTLTIFSYTMVMNVLNRNINNYSPRLVPMLLSEKHHQLILGFTSGTIIYCLVLSIPLNSTSKIYFPSIAASLGIVFTIFCVLLFIYFIHSVSQSIHINYILHDVFTKTKRALGNQSKAMTFLEEDKVINEMSHSFTLNKTGHFHEYDIDKIRKFANKWQIKINVNQISGTFLQAEDVLLLSNKVIPEQSRGELESIFAVDSEVPLEVAEIGFKHLVEVAVKASSPAINDPGTSITCINYLTQLFIIRMNGNDIFARMTDKNTEISVRKIDNGTLLVNCYMEMFQYMKDDFILPQVLKKSLMDIEKHVKANIDVDFKEILSNYAEH